MHDDTFETTRDRYNDLVTRIEEARAAYYDRDAPTISDADYDRMYREVEEIEERYPQLRGAWAAASTPASPRYATSPK